MKNKILKYEDLDKDKIIVDLNSSGSLLSVAMYYTQFKDGGIAKELVFENKQEFIRTYKSCNKFGNSLIRKIKYMLKYWVGKYNNLIRAVSNGQDKDRLIRFLDLSITANRFRNPIQYSTKFAIDNNCYIEDKTVLDIYSAVYSIVMDTIVILNKHPDICYAFEKLIETQEGDTRMLLNRSAFVVQNDENCILVNSEYNGGIPYTASLRLISFDDMARTGMISGRRYLVSELLKYMDKYCTKVESSVDFLNSCIEYITNAVEFISETDLSIGKNTAVNILCTDELDRIADEYKTNPRETMNITIGDYEHYTKKKDKYKLFGVSKQLDIKSQYPIYSVYKGNGNIELFSEVPIHLVGMEDS